MSINDELVIPCDPPDPDLTYRNYFKTCAMLGIEPTPRDQALGLIQDWTVKLAPCFSVPLLKD